MRDLARAAILEVADSADHVGDFSGEQIADDITTVRFTSLHPGYPGWHWCATLIGDKQHVTVNEVWMEPGEGALPIPQWRPWSERIRPGDLGPGDVVPTDPSDDRLAPGYSDVDPDDAAQLPAQWELGLGRERVLSPIGLADAVDRWRSGEDGPSAQIARLADHPCSTCAWLLPIGGVIGQAFGVCAHNMSPSDGHIVAMDHGCGAHSMVEAEPTPIPVTDMLVDDNVLAIVDRGLTPIEAVPSTDDVSHTDESDDDAGVTDIAPPEDVVVAEESGE